MDFGVRNKIVAFSAMSSLRPVSLTEVIYKLIFMVDDVAQSMLEAFSGPNTHIFRSGNQLLRGEKNSSYKIWARMSLILSF